MKLIPKCNQETIRVLVHHLTKVAQNEKINKMSVKNIGMYSVLDCW
jgi:hypothetical protein